MIVWSYCGADWVRATEAAGGTKPVTTPNTSADTLDIDGIVADVIYLNLHGFVDQPNYYGQSNDVIGPTAMTPELVASRRWDGVVVFAEVCFSAADGGSPIARAFLEDGARAFIGSTTTAYGHTGPTIIDGEADRLMRLFRRTYKIYDDPEKALEAARAIFRIVCFPLDADDVLTYESFICLLPEKEKSHDRRKDETKMD